MAREMQHVMGEAEGTGFVQFGDEKVWVVS